MLRTFKTDSFPIHFKTINVPSQNDISMLYSKIEQTPNDPRARLELCIALLKRKSYSEANIECNRLLVLLQDESLDRNEAAKLEAITRFLNGACYSQLGKTADARAEWETVGELDKGRLGRHTRRILSTGSEIKFEW